MPSQGQADPRRGISVSLRWGWGPSASEEMKAYLPTFFEGEGPVKIELKSSRNVA